MPSRGRVCSSGIAARRAVDRGGGGLLQRWRHRVHDLLRLADVRIGGDRPWDVHIHDDRFYRRLLLGGSLAVGEAYVDGWWDCRSLDGLFYRLLRVECDSKLTGLPDLLGLLRATLFNLQKSSRAFRIGEHHYDTDNRLFSAILDRRMIYSCAYWQDAATLDQAQEAKLHFICRKLGLRPGMRLLDIGCGWGGTIGFAAERYGVEAVGITVSKQQASRARDACRGLPVKVRLQDYRELDERFDRILSVGMFEHVGHKNYRAYFEVVRRCLANDGLHLLQTIGKDSSATWTDPWISRHVFPNSALPSARRICDAAEELFVIEDWQNLGADYDKTLKAWFRNLDVSWRSLRDTCNERLYRVWKYYLLSCAGAFRARKLHLWQVVLSPNGVPGGYSAMR